MPPISLKITLAKESRESEEEEKRRPEKKAMVAFFGRGLFGGKVLKNPAR